ncbi:MerR-family transcription regulator protein [Massilia sp. LC238]|nr:MerR-family transcription regulator protein [Massilia sp. LC238]
MYMKNFEKAVQQTVVYRAGTAARMAGLPVETLRVWERRYQISDTQRSMHGQRLYSAEQVERLALLKQLVDQGHGIGLLASLSRQQLESMLEQHNPGQVSLSTVPIRAVVVGASLPRRLVALGADAIGLDLRLRCATLAELGQEDVDVDGEVLIVEKAELDDMVLPRIEALRGRIPAAILVLYRFSSGATIRALRNAGCLVARLPADLSELLSLCRLAMQGERIPLSHTPPPVHAPRYGDETLSMLAQTSGRLTCECPRHLAEVLMTVGSFERYSAQCALRSPEDAELHASLQRSAGQARALLEDALERLALAEGITVVTNRA